MFTLISVRWFSVGLELRLDDTPNALTALVTTKTSLCMLIPPDPISTGDLGAWCLDHGYDLRIVPII